MNLEQTVLQVHIEDIIPNRFQPRLNFDEQGLQELAASIKEHGIIQPLVLRKLGDKYEIIAGERRYKAAQIAGLTTVPAVISNIDDNKSAEVALVENVQRRDLTAIEEARSYKNLLDKGYLTQDQLAKRMGLSQPAIANKLRLLNLDEEVQQALLEEKISERHARTLLNLPQEEQREWLHRIINERLTVRQLDIELRKAKGFADEEDNSTETSDGDIPLVTKIPSIEDIKANAVDIRDYKEPTEPKEEKLETLDIMDEPLTEPENNIDLDNGEFTTVDNSEFDIKRPYDTSSYYDSKPEPPVDVPQDINNNRFFGSMPEPVEPTFASLDSVRDEQPPQEYEFNDNTGAATNSVDDVKEERPNDKMNGNMNINFNMNPDSNPFVDAGEYVPNRQIQPAPEFNRPQGLIKPEFNSQINPTAQMEINPNNRFFTPISRQTSDQMTIISPNVNNTDVDPMAAVDRIVNAPRQEETKDLKYAIDKTRAAIDSLGQDGFYIDVEEIDFPEVYQVTMRIHKDN